MVKKTLEDTEEWKKPNAGGQWIGDSCTVALRRSNDQHRSSASQLHHTSASSLFQLSPAGSQCTIAYTARLPDGTVFDARSQEDPLTFTTDEGKRDIGCCDSARQKVLWNRICCERRLCEAGFTRTKNGLLPYKTVWFWSVLLHCRPGQ